TRQDTSRASVFNVPLRRNRTMATIPHKSFYAHLRGVSGILGQHTGQVLWFSYETGRIVEVTSYAGLTVLGEAAVADTQALMDELHGGAAAIACSREEGVQ